MRHRPGETHAGDQLRSQRLQLCAAANSAAGPLTAIKLGGAPVSYTLETVKGIQYAVFTATAGNYEATYGSPLSLTQILPP